MVVAVVRNFLFLLLIFITIGQKGLLNAKICSKSAETVSPVQKCPANQKEWEDAAQRKNCSEIQNYDNCTNVEYHCLVNEFRNETIEVCTERRILKKGYCPIYSQNKATTDWRNYCGNQTSCNCSSIGYNSTKAYKWQCCYNGTNINSQGMQNDQDKFSPNKTHRGDSVKDQSNNVYVEVWLIPLLLIIAALAVLVFCVCYGMKRQNKTFFEALEIWKNISCTSLRSLDLKKKDMADEVERTLLQKAERHIPLAGTTEVDGSNPDIQEPLTPDGDSSYQGMSTSITQEEIMSLNSGTHDLNTSSEKEVVKSLTSASPNEDSSKQGRPASDVQNKIETQPVLETSAKKDSKSLTPASLNGDSSNQRMSASDTLDEIKTPPVLDTSVKDVSKSLTPASLNEDSSKQGMPALDAQDKIETPPVLETSAKKDSKLSTPESPNRDSSNLGMPASDILENIVTPVLESSAKEDSPNRDSLNLGMSASDTPNENDPKPGASASKTTGGDISKSETSGSVLIERVENMQTEMKNLKEEIDKIFGRGVWDLNYKLRSANMKIKSTNRTIYEPNECADIAHLEMKASEVEQKLHQLRLIINPMSKGFNQTNDKLRYPIHALEYKQVEDEDEPEAEDNEAHKAEDGDLTYKRQQMRKYMKRKTDESDVVLVDVDDLEEASSNEKKEVAFADKPFLEKLDYLKIRTEKLLREVETLRNAVYARLSLGNANTIRERLKEVEDDVDILSESYNLTASSSNQEAISIDKQLEELNTLYETLKKSFDGLRLKVG